MAKTFRGAGSGGISPNTLLLVAFAPADVLGEDADKVRVKRLYVVDVLDILALLPLVVADLSGADLYGANYSQLSLWPAGFNPEAAGAVLV